ncbi:MAG: hypothetical protein KC656_33490 [Myxococcales bacterium]|nr:hypothetical protein [Myxococcales bacterium]
MRTWMLLGVLGGCDPEGSDIVTPVDEPPDIRGTYGVTLSDASGCEDHPEGGVAWLETGDLVVDGEPDALTFTFGDGTVLDGSVDATFTFQSSGTAVHEGVQQDLFFDGLAFIGDETWDLDGDLTADLLDSTGSATTCTLTATLEAVQIP